MYFSFPQEEEGYTEVLVSRFANTPPILKLRAIEVHGMIGKGYKARIREGKNGVLVEDYPSLFGTPAAALSKAHEMARRILKERMLLK